MIVLACIPDDPESRVKISLLVGQPCVPYKDSVPGTCSLCRRQVWIGPKQQAAFARNPSAFDIQCLTCAAQNAVCEARQGQAPHIVPLTEKPWGD